MKTRIPTTKAKLRKAFGLLCINKKDLGKDDNKWRSCNKCILCDIECDVSHEGTQSYIGRSLCFAIWHGNILGQENKGIRYGKGNRI